MHAHVRVQINIILSHRLQSEGFMPAYQTTKSLWQKKGRYERYTTNCNECIRPQIQNGSKSARHRLSDGPATDDGKAERPQIVFFK